MIFLPPARSTACGTNSAHFRGTLIWNELPSSIKRSKSNIEFKTNLKHIGNTNCGCVIYVENSFYLFVFFLDKFSYIVSS